MCFPFLFLLWCLQELKTPEKKKQIEQVTAPSAPPPPQSSPTFTIAIITLTQDLEAMRRKLESLGNTHQRLTWQRCD
jgi:hypothetical protein